MKNVFLSLVLTCLSFSSYADTYGYQDFNPREVAQACAKLNRKSVSKECYDNAKEKNIPVDLINVCMKFVRNETRIECIDLAFQEGATADQMNECLTLADFTGQIFNCIRVAAQKNLSLNDIRQCKLNNETSFYFQNARTKCLTNL